MNGSPSITSTSVTPSNGTNRSVAFERSTIPSVPIVTPPGTASGNANAKKMGIAYANTKNFPVLPAMTSVNRKNTASRKSVARKCPA